MSQPTLRETHSDIIDCLYEDLVMLDEQAGEFDEVTNAQIDEQRRKIMEQICELGAAE